MPRTPQRTTTTHSARQPQSGREGKVQVKAWVEPEFRKKLKALSVELGVPMETLFVQQLEALLRKHGVK